MSGHRVHWLGAGLSSGPGIVRLAQSGRNLVLWNRTIEKAQAVFSDSPAPSSTTLRRFELGNFQQALDAGDIVVSMLPAGMHPEIAELCLSRGAHLVTTSYISDAMRKLDGPSRSAGLCFVNECGLDPGIDHVLAHLLVSEYKEFLAAHPATFATGGDEATLHFKSYCGGFPKHANDFKYKFSWSPVGVLRALTNTARCIEAGRETVASRAWEVVKPFSINGESFEVYPNRDSIPYVKEYGFEDAWNLGTFVRGTIRLGGWSNAWSEIFAQIPGASNEKLEAMGAELWKKNAYEPGEQDRVVLYVSLEAKIGAKTAWQKAYLIDDSGTGRDTAMGRLVSWPATLAVEGIEKRYLKPGVTGAPHEPSELRRWMRELSALGVSIQVKDRLG